MTGQAARSAPPRIAFVAPPGAEEDAAFAWLAAHPDLGTAARFTPDQLDDAVLGAAVVWVHAASPPGVLSAESLAVFVNSGGGVLLTLRAAMLAGAMGFELAPPNEDVESRWRGAADGRFADGPPGAAGLPLRGLATFGPHPLVEGLHNGTYCWLPTEGERYSRTCYVHGVRPVGGRVIAVERYAQSQNPNRIVAWEYQPVRGRIVCVGAYVNFAAPDALLRAQLERLAANALRYVATGPADGARVTGWPERATHAAPAEGLALPEPLDLEGALPDPDDDPATLESDAAHDEPFDLAGRRALLVGRERQGLRELWLHPYRAVAGWELSIDREPVEAGRLTVTPDVLVRTLETGRRRITERCFVALEQPFALVEYAAARKGRASLAQSAAALEVTLTLDLRRMWPYPAGSGGNLRFRNRPDGRVALVTAEGSDGVAAVFVNRPAQLALKAVRPGGIPAVECTVAAPLGVPLRLAVLGGSSRDDFERAWRAVSRLGMRGLVRQRVQRAATMRQSRLSLRAPDERLPRALEWARRRLDLFTADVPGVGRSLMAGYASSEAGWGEGRPGYAWFFGRDACWSALALLAAGEHSVPRQVIRFLGDTQDVTGKVIHEVTTSGQHHYDAADATPLYLLLVARYLAWTGDREFVKAVWPQVQRALAFCLSTDRDGDGLIENARVGHGWLESPELSQVTLYLACVWHAALEGLARAAGVLGDAPAQAGLVARAARARRRVDEQLYDARRGCYARDEAVGGKRTWTQTALQAMPLLLGAGTLEQSARWLEAVAGDGFTARWGVRMLSQADAQFNPAEGQAGAVWPLLTGWVAGAEYRAGRAASAFRHVLANAALASGRQLGAFDEVLHGSEERGAGVCGNMAWSAAALLAPVAEGLLGLEPGAPEGRLTIAPALPAGWDWMEGRGIRCGETAFDIRLRRSGPALDVGLRRTAGPPLWLTIAPLLERPASAVEIDGQRLTPAHTTIGEGVRSAVSFQSAEENQLRFELSPA